MVTIQKLRRIHLILNHKLPKIGHIRYFGTKSKILTKPPRACKKNVKRGSAWTPTSSAALKHCNQDPEFKLQPSGQMPTTSPPNEMSTVHCLPAKERLENKNRKAVLCMIAMEFEQWAQDTGKHKTPGLF